MESFTGAKKNRARKHFFQDSHKWDAISCVISSIVWALRHVILPYSNNNHDNDNNGNFIYVFECTIVNLATYRQFTNAAWDWIIMYVGWVCCWFSSLHPEGKESSVGKEMSSYNFFYRCLTCTRARPCTRAPAPCPNSSVGTWKNGGVQMATTFFGSLAANALKKVFHFML